MQIQSYETVEKARDAARQAQQQEAELLGGYEPRRIVEVGIGEEIRDERDILTHRKAYVVAAMNTPDSELSFPAVYRDIETLPPS